MDKRMGIYFVRWDEVTSRMKTLLPIPLDHRSNVSIT